MTIPRSLVVDTTVTGLYHCISRCVRRAFLCGDRFDHRRDWIKSRLQDLTDIFAVDVCGYAVMSNHFHVVLRIDPVRAESWSGEEVAHRWLRLFPPRSDPSAPDGLTVEEAIEQLAVRADRIAVLRGRLSDLSWFMRCLKEPIARRSNREDGCTGRFWEGRFKCHRLLDEAAILACLVYIDLNVIRAGLATTPEQSDHTSVQDRIRVRRHLRRRRSRPPRRASRQWTRLVPDLERGRTPRHDEDGIWLAPIASVTRSRRRGRAGGLLPVSLDQYLGIVDATGRLMRAGQRGVIPPHLLPILKRLQLDESTWRRTVCGVGEWLGTAIGKAASLAQEAERRRRRWVVGALPI